MSMISRVKTQTLPPPLFFGFSEHQWNKRVPHLIAFKTISGFTTIEVLLSMKNVRTEQVLYLNKTQPGRVKIKPFYFLHLQKSVTDSQNFRRLSSNVFHRHHEV